MTAPETADRCESARRPCSHGEGCELPWSVHDWSYEAEVARNPDYANEPLFGSKDGAP